MILNVSSRTDIVAFYSTWFMKRYHEGFVDVRNPFYPSKVSRIYFKDVDAIVFCTKNPIPILKYIPDIHHPILFQVTITPYWNDIEVSVPPKGQIIEAIKKLSKIIKKEFLYIRYDPILVNSRYSISYHIKAFEKLCSILEGYVSHIIISFVDEYKNVKNHRTDLQYKELTEEDYQKIGMFFSDSARCHNMTVQTCFESRNLVEYGFLKSDCLSSELAFKLTNGKKFPKWKARKGGKCTCVEMVDIGFYNSCKHFCKYCYANYDEKKVKENYAKHDVNSSLLIGKLEKNDDIKQRECS